MSVIIPKGQISSVRLVQFFVYYKLFNFHNMQRYNSIENSEPRMKKASTLFSTKSIVAPDPTTPNLFYPAQPGDDAQGVCGEDIRATDSDFTSERRIAVDFPVNDSDEFEAVVHGAEASSNFENQTFDVYGDAINDPLSEQVEIGTPGTQFIYMRTTQSSATDPLKNTAVFRFNRGAGPQIAS